MAGATKTTNHKGKNSRQKLKRTMNRIAMAAALLNGPKLCARGARRRRRKLEASHDLHDHAVDPTIRDFASLIPKASKIECAPHRRAKTLFLTLCLLPPHLNNWSSRCTKSLHPHPGYTALSRHGSSFCHHMAILSSKMKQEVPSQKYQLSIPRPAAKHATKNGPA